MINIEPSTEEGNSEFAKTLDGGFVEYCKAAPNSKEWQAYQEQRVLSINVLKMKNLKLKRQANAADVAAKTSKAKTKHQHLDPIIATSKTYDVPLQLPTETSGIPAILKKPTKYTFRPQFKDTSSSNVTWKEPVADTKLLPTGWMKVPNMPKQTQTVFREKHPISKIFSAENNVKKEKKKSDITRNQFSSILETSAKSSSKPYKRNNGKSNLGRIESLATIISLEAEYKDNSTEEVNKIGKSKNHVEENEINSGNSSKKGTSGMPPARLKFQAETALPIDALPPTTEKGKCFLKQTLEEAESSRKTKAVEMGEAYLLSSEFGIKHSPQVFPDKNNNNNNVFCENTSAIPSNEINHVKASSLQSGSNSNDVQWKWLREAKVDAVHDSVAYSFHRQDINGNNGDLCASTQKQAEERSMESSKFISGTETKSEETVNDGSSGGAVSCLQEGVDKLAEMNGKNVDNKPIEKYGKELISKTLLSRVVCEKANLLLGKNKLNGQGVSANINQGSGFRETPFQKQNKLLKFEEVETLLNHFTPPKLPQIKVCNVLPGTPQWEKYWEDFNQKVADYYTCVETFSKHMDDLLVDEDGCEYKKQLKNRFHEEMAIQLSMGMTMPKPPLIRQPLTDTVEIGGYVIRPLGGAVKQAKVSTSDYNSFRLEIPSENINNDLEGITVDTKLNLMTIAIPSGIKGSTVLKLVQITVPSYKKVQNLKVGGPLNNGGKIVVIGK